MSGGCRRFAGAECSFWAFVFRKIRRRSLDTTSIKRCVGGVGVALEALSDTKRRPGRTPEDNAVFGKLLRWPCVSWVRDLPSQKSSRLPWAAGHRLVKRLKRALGPPKELTGRPKLSRKSSKRLRYFPGASGLMVLSFATSQIYRHLRTAGYLPETPTRARIFYVYKASIFIFLALSLVVKPSLAMQPLGRFESLFL